MTRDALLVSAATGWLAGMRSLAAPAFASAWFARGGKPAGRLGHALGRPGVRWVLAALAIGEAVADKRATFDRTALPSLAGRAGAGALTAAALAPAWRRSWRPRDTRNAALLGACAAVASSFANLWLRRSAERWTGRPQRDLGLAEDALALALGAAIAAR